MISPKTPVTKPGWPCLSDVGFRRGCLTRLSLTPCRLAMPCPGGTRIATASPCPISFRPEERIYDENASLRTRHVVQSQIFGCHDSAVSRFRVYTKTAIVPGERPRTSPAFLLDRRPSALSNPCPGAPPPFRPTTRAYITMDMAIRSLTSLLCIDDIPCNLQ